VRVLSESRLQRRFREVIFRETGIKMPETKEHLIAARLRRRLIAGNFRDLDAYLAFLFEEGGLRDEWPDILDLITTNKTDFFREAAHFDILSQRILPAALRAARPGGTVRFRFWSAAASTGAEAYTAAMLLADAVAADARLDWMILGTDISPGVVDQAGRAVYSRKEVAPVPVEMRSRYLMSGRPGRGTAQFRIVPELRRRVRFAEMNLIDPPYPVASGLDVIFLRNVLIYFDPDQQARVIAEVVNHLKPGGHFFVGHSESMVVEDPRLDQIAPAAFRRRDTDR